MAGVWGCGDTFAGAVGRVHGGDGQRGTGRVAHASLVDGAHPEDVAATLHQTGDWVAGKLDRGVIALDPVSGANLTSTRRGHREMGVTERWGSPKG